jgi:hypothetical protein
VSLSVLASPGFIDWMGSILSDLDEYAEMGYLEIKILYIKVSDLRLSKR